MNRTIISGKRIKKSAKKTQHKIKQTNDWPVFKETVKVKKTNKKIQLSWNLTFIGLFCKRDSTRFTTKYEFNTIKILKFKIKVQESIMREEGPGRSKSYQRFKKYILKLIVDSPFNS